jgi:hypothetical protein
LEVTVIARALAIFGLSFFLLQIDASAQPLMPVDKSQQIVISGVVKYVRYQGNAVHLQLLVPDAKGAAQEWELFGAANKVRLVERKLSRSLSVERIKQWDTIAVALHPSTSRSQEGELVSAQRMLQLNPTAPK